MKKILLLILLQFPIVILAQTNYVSLSSNDELNSFGTIIEINDDVPNTTYTFMDNGAPPSDNLVELGGKIYGLADNEGPLGKGSLYEFDYLNQTFEVLDFFEAVGSTSTNYITNLCTDGVTLYALQQQFFSGTSIVEYNVDTQSITSLVSLGDIGISEVKSLFYAGNNKLYGVSRPISSADNIIFSYDIVSGTLTNEFTFNTTDGDWCHSLLHHSNGNIYGATTYGGANNEGVIFEFNTITNTYTVLFDLTTTLKADNLVEGDGNVLYGYVNPLTGGGARIYQFDLGTNTFSNIYSFPSDVQPEGNDATFRDFNPLFFDAGVVYGYSELSSSSEQVFFSYDIGSGTFSSSTGNNITTPFFRTSDNRIVYGKSGGNGMLMEYDTATASTNEILGTDFGTHGIDPHTIIKASSGIIYGVCGENLLSNYSDRLFSYDPSNDTYSVLIDFNDFPDFQYGNNPLNLIETSSGLIYVYTAFSNAAFGQGKLIEYNPSDGSIMLAHEFSNMPDDSVIGEDITLFEKDDVIYGIKRWADDNSILYLGTLFSYNTLTHTYSVVYESDQLTGHMVGLLSSQNIFYGITSSGGTNNEGFIYSIDISNSQFTIIENLDQSGEADLVELANGDIYGVLQNSHGTEGSIFKIDGNTGAFSNYYQFDHATNGNGQYPYRLYNINDNLYTLTEAPNAVASILRRLIVEFNTISDTSTIIFDEERFGGIPLRPDMYVTSDNRLLGSTHEEFFSFEQGDTSVQTVFSFDADTEKVFSLIDVNDSSLSTEKFEDDLKVSVFPNPTSDFLQINSPSAITSVEIYSFQGQKLVSYSNQKKIDVRDLSNGLYFLKVKDEFGKLQTVKFIKK